MANTDYTTTDTTLQNDKEPATKHDVTEGGILGAVGGAIVGGLAGGPIGAVIGAIAGGAASAGAVDIVDKHDHDYARTVAGSHTDDMDNDATVYDHAENADGGVLPRTTPLSGTAAYSDTVPSTGTASYADTAPYTDTAATTFTQDNLTGTRGTDGEVVIPIVEEELQVGKRQVQSGGARIHTDVIETPVEQSVNLREEHVTVDRHAVDRAVTDADTAFTDKSFEVTETQEVPVVAKTARVVEEVVIGKTATDRTETISDTVRRTDVDVEELNSTAR